LVNIENRCAIDSSGFRTTRFHYYRNERYTPERLNTWMKLHVAVGVRTHAILAAHVTEGTAADAPQLTVLMERAAAAGFKFQEVLADKAYGSRKNFDVVANYDALLFSPPKSNATGQAKGSQWYHRMFLYFNCYLEDFEKHYGDRAQVESAFGSMKQTLGETLLSHKVDSQTNELYAKAIAHNIRMLIRAMLECGVLPNFLAPAPTDRAEIPAGLTPEARAIVSENWQGPDLAVGISPPSG
jgi:transposase